MGEGECTKTLEKLWKSGREGTLCPLEQAKAWGFREAQRARGEEENHQEIANSVVKVGALVATCEMGLEVLRAKQLRFMRRQNCEVGIKTPLRTDSRRCQAVTRTCV